MVKDFDLCPLTAPAPQHTEEERETFEERAAIMEHDGGLSREAAEREAWRIILRERRRREGRP